MGGRKQTVGAVQVVGVTDRCRDDMDTSQQIFPHEHVSGDRARPASVLFEFVTVLKWWTISLLNKKTLDMQRLEVL